MKQYELTEVEKELIQNRGTGIVQEFRGYVEGVLIDNTSVYLSADFINNTLQNETDIKDRKDLIESYVACVDKCYEKLASFSLEDIESEAYKKIEDPDHKTEYYYMEPFYEELDKRR